MSDCARFFDSCFFMGEVGKEEAFFFSFAITKVYLTKKFNMKMHMTQFLFVKQVWRGDMWK